jgi:CPA2 family monovalent cation:H+ antiporter-2/glutathione-regulated potassium-efflux system protein KefB
LGSVLGYLIAGALIGPSGARLVIDVDQITEVSELGVVMLLFLIGLELRPRRLWVMRRAVFGLGTAQLVATTAVLAFLIHRTGLGWPGATVLGAGLALSSTAIVLPLLAERELLGTPAGRDGFAVLLFQDLAFIPLVALVPLLGGGAEMARQMVEHVPWLDVLRAAGAIGIILLGGRFVLPLVFRAIGGAQTQEVFTATALLIVVGTATIAHVAGLSMSLGAFMAGMLLSGSAYRHELQADIEPFKGLLLGFFFMAVGMGAQLGLAVSEPWLIAGGVAALVAVKLLLGAILSAGFGRDRRNALQFALALAQGSEFSFVLFAAAVDVGALDPAAADRATLVVALSMALTPILFAVSERFVIPLLDRRRKPEFDVIVDADAPVIIAGFGRVGQIVGRVLRMQGIDFTALEEDPGQIEVVRQFGNKVYFGSAARLDLLRAAGAETARVLVVALSDVNQTLEVVDLARRNFPDLKLLVRSRNRRHTHLLMERGVDAIIRETFQSSLELSGLTLAALGVPKADADRAIAIFRAHDEQQLVKAFDFYQDERQLIQNAQQAADELASLFEADPASPRKPVSSSAGV